MQAGRITTVEGLIDPEQADREWEQNSHARAGSRRSGAAPRDEPNWTPRAADSASGGEKEPDYSTARARRERAEASIAEIELAKLSGNLLDRATVEREAFTAARTVRDRLMNLPTKVAPLLASISDAFELERRLRESIRRALDECQEAVADAPH